MFFKRKPRTETYAEYLTGLDDAAFDEVGSYLHAAWMVAAPGSEERAVLSDALADAETERAARSGQL